MSKQLEKNIQRLGSIFPETQRIFHNISIEVSKTGDLTIAQYRVLALLDHFGKLTVNDLKEQLNVAQSSASGIIDRLEQTGFVKKSVSDADKRVTFIELTSDAKNLLQVKMHSMEDVYRRLLENLSDEEQIEFISSFEKILKSVKKSEQLRKQP